MDHTYDQQVGKRIRAIRKERKLTQEQLSARLQTYGCDVTHSALAKIEAGQRHIYAAELRALREILKVSCDELLP